MTVALVVFGVLVGFVAGVFAGRWEFRDWRTWPRRRIRGHTYVQIPDDLTEGET